MVPRREGKPSIHLGCDHVTVVCALVVGSAARNVGPAKSRSMRDPALNWTHLFQHITAESLGLMNTRAQIYSFLTGLGRKISNISGDDRGSSIFSFQRYNATMLHESLTEENRMIQMGVTVITSLYFSSFFFLPAGTE